MENYLRVITNRVDTNEKDINIINHKIDDINSTELEEMTLKTKLDSLVEGMKEEILEETKFEFLPLWKKYKALEEKYEKLNTKYNYMVKENFSLHNDIAMLREDMANINSTIKEEFEKMGKENTKNNKYDKIKEDVTMLLDSKSTMQRTLTEHSYRIKDTKQIVTTCIKKSEDIENITDILDENIQIVREKANVNSNDIEEVQLTLETIRNFTKNELKSVLQTQKELVDSVQQLKNQQQSAPPIEIDTNTAPTKHRDNPYVSKTPAKVPSTVNPFDMFDIHQKVTPSIQPKKEPTYPQSAPPTSKFDPIDLTTLWETTNQSTKPVLPSYNTKYSFKKWQSLCLLEFSTSKSKYYKSFVVSSDSGEKILDPTMSTDKKSDLFALLNKAIKAENLGFLDHSIIARSDGLELWKLCESRYAPAEKSPLEKKQLERTFENMKKGKNESPDDFLKRIETQVTTLATYGIYPTHQDKALTLLKGLQSDKLEGPILSVTYNDSNYNIWVKPDNLKHTLEKAKSLILHKTEMQKYLPKNETYADKAKLGQETGGGTGNSPGNNTNAGKAQFLRNANAQILQFKNEMSK